MPRRHRLTRPEEFRAVLRGGARSGTRRAGGHVVMVHRLDVDAGAGRQPRPARVGFVVSKAVGNSVVRHRVTRRLRALVAERLDTLPPGTDLVVRAQPAAAAADSSELGSALDRALAKVAP
nr:ribonuclease P protein component [Ornithinimicrobium sediminis]